MKSLSSRVTGGFLRGREIVSPESEKTHPMGSRERLAILNSIGPDIKDAKVLDLFAGTGALGIEALSRGARHASFVEKHHKTAAILRKNLESLKLSDTAVVYEKNAEDVELGNSFDFVFIDPPYDLIQNFDILSILRKYDNAKKIILSHPANFVCELEGFDKKTKSYAAANISVFTKQGR